MSEKLEELRELYKEPDIVGTVKEEIFKWLRHIMQTAGERISRKLLESSMLVRKKQGRLRSRWRKEVENDFYKESDKLILSFLIKHKIPITYVTSIFLKSYGFPGSQKVELDKQINELLERNIVAKNSSPYSTYVFLILINVGKDGTISQKQSRTSIFC